MGETKKKRKERKGKTKQSMKMNMKSEKELVQPQKDLDPTVANSIKKKICETRIGVCGRYS